MNSEWKTAEIGSFAKLRSGYSFKSADWRECGTSVIKIANVKAGRIVPEGCGFVDDGVAEAAKEWFTKPGDVLIAMTGYVGEIARVHREERYLINQRVGRFEFASDSEVDPTFFSYVLQQSDLRGQMERIARGSAQPNLSSADAHKLRIPIPPRRTQAEIAATLTSLDDRIDLLRETNATLEAIAQALFKSWFVDFDPVHAKQQGIAPAGMDEATAALFPEGFEESELGLVPMGWQATNLARLTKDYNGSIQTGPFGSQLHASDYVDSGIPVVMPKDIRDRRATTDSIARIRVADADRLSRHKLSAGDIVFSRRGDVEKHALITQREVGWICGTGCLLVRPGATWWSPTFLSMTLDSPNARSWLVRHAVGATMPNINTGVLGSVPVVAPTAALLTAFEDIVAVTEEQRSQNSSTAETLATLRDTLLPRLISGQLLLPEALDLEREITT